MTDQEFWTQAYLTALTNLCGRMLPTNAINDLAYDFAEGALENLKKRWPEKKDLPKITMNEVTCKKCHGITKQLGGMVKECAHCGTSDFF